MNLSPAVVYDYIKLLQDTYGWVRREDVVVAIEKAFGIRYHVNTISGMIARVKHDPSLGNLIAKTGPLGGYRVEVSRDEARAYRMRKDEEHRIRMSNSWSTSEKKTPATVDAQQRARTENVNNVLQAIS